MKQIVCYTLLLVLLVTTSKAQTSSSTIVGVSYFKTFGGIWGNRYQICLEIKSDGHIRMYNDLYDSTLMYNMSDLLNEGNKEISASDLKGLLIGDTLGSYYTGKISSREYEELIELAILVKADTAKHRGCFTFDSPYEGLKIYINDSYKKYIACSFTTHPTISSLVRKLNEIAYKKGYERSSTKFNFQDLF